MKKRKATNRKKPQKKEARIDNQKIRFKEMSFHKEEDKAKEERKGMEYIGTSCIYYLNGVKHRHPYRLHFFRK